MSNGRLITVGSAVITAVTLAALMVSGAAQIEGQPKAVNLSVSEVATPETPYRCPQRYYVHAMEDCP